MNKRMALASLTVQEYMRGTWLFAEILLTLGVLFLYSHYFWELEASELFLILGMYAIIIAILTTVRVINREINPRIYIILTKAIARKDYIYGKVLAIFVINTVFILFLFFVGFAFTGLSSQFPLLEALCRVGLIFIVLLLTEIITLYFSTLINSKTSIIFGLILIVLGLYQPVEFLKYLLPPFQQLIKATYSTWNPNLIYYVFLFGVYFYLFWHLATSEFNKREIDFESK